MAKESSLRPYILKLKYKIRNKTVYGRIENVFEELGFVTKSGLKPILVKQNPTDYGWYVVYHLPASISWKDIESKLHYFEEQAGGIIDLDHKHAEVFFEVYTKEFEQEEEYCFEPKPKNSKQILLPVGKGLDGKLKVVNLPDIPHILDAGQTRAGKTVFLHSSTVSLIKQKVIVCAIDLVKTEFSYLRKHAIVVNTPEDAHELIEKLLKVCDKRFKNFEPYDVSKWQDYPLDDMPYMVLIVDELAFLKEKKTQEKLGDLARICAGAGMSIILATQRPSATTFKNFTDIRALFPGVMCFAIKDKVNSQIVLDNDHATKIPKAAKGRAIWQWDDEIMVQTMYLPPQKAKEMVRTIESPLESFKRGAEWTRHEPSHLWLPAR